MCFNLILLTLFPKGGTQWMIKDMEIKSGFREINGAIVWADCLRLFFL